MSIKKDPECKTNDELRLAELVGSSEIGNLVTNLGRKLEELIKADLIPESGDQLDFVGRENTGLQVEIEKMCYKLREEIGKVEIAFQVILKSAYF